MASSEPAKSKDSVHAVVELTELPGSRDSQLNLNGHSPSEILPAKTWPQQPIPLVPDKKASLLMTLYDAVLVAVPILLVGKIALVIAAWHIDINHRGIDLDLVSTLTTFLIEFNGQMTTAFTIVFVTVMSTLVRRYALWKAQRGAYVSELEQLQGSISLPSTIKLIWSLRAFTTTSIALVGVWSFYYLGSQATKEEFRLVSSSSFHKQPAALPGPNYTSGFSPYQNPFAQGWDIGDLNSQFIASDYFYNNGGNHPVGTDQNGSPMLPDLTVLLNPPPDSDPSVQPFKRHRHGWLDVSKQSIISSRNAYSSMLGRALTLYDPASHVTHYSTTPQVLGDYQATTTYLKVGCDMPQALAYEAFPNGTFANQTVSMNMTKLPANAPTDIYGKPLRTFDLWVRWIPDEDDGIPTNGSGKTTCNITEIQVDVKVHCQDSGCFSHRIRYVNDTSQQNATSFSTPFDDDQFAAAFFSNLLLSRGVQTNLSLPSSENSYLSASLATYLPQDLISPGSLDPNIMTDSLNPVLTLIFNTYYQISQAQTSVIPFMEQVISNGTDGVFNRLTFKGAVYDPHYGIFWPWIAVDFVSCFILLTAAIVSHLLRTQTLAPDIFGYVSSLTRDNPHIDLPNNGTTLNGIERARLLKTVKVKIGDVSRHDEQVGRVGLARVDTGNRTVDNLRPTTAYV